MKFFHISTMAVALECGPRGSFHELKQSTCLFADFILYCESFVTLVLW